MRKRKHDGKTYYVFTDDDYHEVVGNFVSLDTDESVEPNLECHGCVDRFERGCPTRAALKIKLNDSLHQCNIRILDENGLANYLAHKMGATHD